MTARLVEPLREEPSKDPLGLVRVLSEKMKKRIAPVVIDAKDAEVNRNIETGDKPEAAKSLQAALTLAASKRWSRPRPVAAVR